MECEICGKGITDGVDLYRVNEKGKGIYAIWRCWKDLSIEQRKQHESNRAFINDALKD